MISENQASDLLSQLDEIEAHVGKYRAWRRKARRYLFIKLPATGALLHASARFHILVVVVPLMLLVGTIDFLFRLGTGRDAHGSSKVFAGPNATLSVFEVAWPEVALLTHGEVLGAR